MSARGAAIAGCGAISAVGRGMAAIDRAIACNTQALSPCPESAGGEKIEGVFGAIGERAWAGLRSEFSNRARQRTFLLSAAAITDARSEAQTCLDKIAPERIALVLSTTKADIDGLETDGESGGRDETPLPHVVHHRLAGDLAEAFGARGEVQCASVACASGLVAMAQGARLIELGEADAAIVVGVDYLSRFLVEGFRCLDAVDPRGCRPFDADRAGMTPGEAGAAVVLARTDLAPEAATRVTGWGTSNDANHLTGPSRDGSGMALAIGRALAKAGLEPEAIDLINSHATATPFNDAMEARAYRTIFGDGEEPAVCASKGMFGHTFGAGGILESIVCDRAARAGLRPGTPGLNEPDPGAPRGLKAEPERATFRRTLKVNAGFAGLNGAIVLEHA